MARSRILIVDDQPANVHVLAEALRGDHELLVANSAARALELAAGADLILLDVMLPDTDWRSAPGEAPVAGPMGAPSATSLLRPQTPDGFRRRDEPVAGPMGAPSQARTALLRPQTPDGFRRRDEPVAGPMGASSQARTALLRPQTPVGFEVCRRLRADPVTRRIPVIFVTALEQTEDEELGFAAGGVDYIVKPIRPAIVRARVRTHLELKAARDQLERLATLDGLTGIANRRCFDEAVDVEWRRATRNRRPLTLAIADVDHFKAYNDRHGHAGGDACLRIVARTLASQCRRPGELVARYGGEEFGLVLPDHEVEAAAAFAQRALDAVATAEAVGLGPDARVTLSLGAVSLWPTPELAAEVALRGADEALYEAKGSGRRRAFGRDLGTGGRWQVVTGESRP